MSNNKNDRTNPGAAHSPVVAFKPGLKIVRSSEAVKRHGAAPPSDETDFAYVWNRLNDSVQCNVSPVLRFINEDNNGLPPRMRNNVRALTKFLEDIPPFLKLVVKEHARLRDRVAGLELQNQELETANKQLLKQLFERVAVLEQERASWIKAVA